MRLATTSVSVGVIMGSDSDLPVMKAACEILEEFEVSFEVQIVSAHRTPEFMMAYGKTARDRGLSVIIAGAGGAAHLPGMMAAVTTLPVIGVPVKTSALSGVDSLHSIVQMPRGVPVATVAIGNATNAALLAIRILAVTNATLTDKLQIYAEQQKKTVEAKGQDLLNRGWRQYLDTKGAPSSTTVM